MAQFLVLLWGFVDGLPPGSKCFASDYSIEESQEEALLPFLTAREEKGKGSAN